MHRTALFLVLAMLTASVQAQDTQPFTVSGEILPGACRITFPDVDLVPIYLENLHRSMPKGKHVPLPIICTIRIGDPLPRIAHEEKQVFLERAREAIVRLSK